MMVKAVFMIAQLDNKSIQKEKAVLNNVQLEKQLLTIHLDQNALLVQEKNNL